jgi:hypothetical protein
MAQGELNSFIPSNSWTFDQPKMHQGVSFNPD